MHKNKLLRTPLRYDGTDTTTHHIRHLLPVALSNIGDVFQQRPDLILAAWPDLVGPLFASMTQAIKFVEGVLTVKVTNSTLFSLLNQNEKPRLLLMLRKRFPQVSIKTIQFRIG